MNENVMTKTQKYENELRKIVKECDDIMKKMLPGSFAFAKWIPLYFECDKAEAAFARDIINYYALLYECCKYLWYEKKGVDNSEDGVYCFFEKKKIVYLKNMRDDEKNNGFLTKLKNMRNFVCHRYDDNYERCYNEYRDYLGLMRDADKAKYIVFDQNQVDVSHMIIKGYNDDNSAIDEKFWQDKRGKLFDDTRNAMNDIKSALEEARLYKEDFIEGWKKSIALWYTDGYGMGLKMRYQFTNWSGLRKKDFIIKYKTTGDEIESFADEKERLFDRRNPETNPYNNILDVINDNKTKRYKMEDMIVDYLDREFDAEFGSSK